MQNEEIKLIEVEIDRPVEKSTWVIPNAPRLQELVNAKINQLKLMDFEKNRVCAKLTQFKVTPDLITFNLVVPEPYTNVVMQEAFQDMVIVSMMNLVEYGHRCGWDHDPMQGVQQQ